MEQQWGRIKAPKSKRGITKRISCTWGCSVEEVTTGKLQLGSRSTKATGTVRANPIPRRQAVGIPRNGWNVKKSSRAFLLGYHEDWCERLCQKLQNLCLLQTTENEIQDTSKTTSTTRFAGNNRRRPHGPVSTHEKRKRESLSGYRSFLHVSGSIPPRLSHSRHNCRNTGKQYFQSLGISPVHCLRQCSTVQESTVGSSWKEMGHRTLDYDHIPSSN